MNDRGLDAAERTVNNNTSTVKCSTRPYTARAFYYPAHQLAPIANSEVELTLFVKSNHLRVPSPPCPQHKHYSQRSVNFLGFPLTTRCPFGKKSLEWEERTGHAINSIQYAQHRDYIGKARSSSSVQYFLIFSAPSSFTSSSRCCHRIVPNLSISSFIVLRLSSFSPLLHSLKYDSNLSNPA
jgi:hypothetical protein